MTPPDKQQLLKNYMSDADHMVNIYCNTNLPPRSTGEYHYKTTGILNDYIKVKGYKADEIDIIIGLIRAKSPNPIDPYMSPIFVQKLTGENDEQLLQLVRDLKPFGNDYDYLYEIDLNYIKIPEAFEMSEKWAKENEYLTDYRIWRPKSQGRLGTFLRILMNKRIIYGPKHSRLNVKLTIDQIDKYFSDRYQVSLLGDLLKPKFAKQHYSEFKDMDDMLTNNGWHDQIGTEFP